MQKINSASQKLLFQRKPELLTSISPVECYVCGKGIEDGYSVTAKKIRDDIVLFCDVHYSLQ
ncbi:MAG: hypothetical protein R3327_03440 [Nitrosopumilaceae archaeon]|nr:hypothetical protein [Nitrosopumilaceae archaeon]